MSCGHNHTHSSHAHTHYKNTYARLLAFVDTRGSRFDASARPRRVSGRVRTRMYGKCSKTTHTHTHTARRGAAKSFSGAAAYNKTNGYVECAVVSCDDNSLGHCVARPPAPRHRYRRLLHTHTRLKLAVTQRCSAHKRR